MKKTHYFYVLFVISTLLVVSCEKVDPNYEGPQETIKGKFVDKLTNKAYFGSAVINLIELSWDSDEGKITSQSLSVKPDGTFLNTKIFKGMYRIEARGGFYPDPANKQEVEVSGVTEIDYQVTPYVKIDVSRMEVTGHTLNVKYALSRPTTYSGVGDTIIAISSRQVQVSRDPFFAVQSVADSPAETHSGRIHALQAAILTSYTKTATIPTHSYPVKYYVRVAVSVINKNNAIYNGTVYCETKEFSVQ